MCSRVSEGDADPGAHFSRGAMSMLASVPKVTVVATCTARQPIPAALSSDMCRWPVALPVMDVDAAMQAIPGLQFPVPAVLTREQRRLLWATLRFRLTMKLTQINIANFGSPSTPPGAVEDFLEKFAEAAKIENTTKALSLKM